MKSPHSISSSPSGREPTPAERAATVWVARCDAGLTSDQQIEFERWLAADPRHGELFEEYDGAWALFDRVRAATRPAGNQAAVPFRSATPASTDRGRGAKSLRPLRRHAASVWVATTLAAAAALMFAYVEWWRPAHFATTVATEIGRFQKTPLPDGSLIELNTDSLVTVAYRPGERRVRLERGEAHFTVAKNSARPFVVEANGVVVRAVGTAFNVRLRAAAIEVLVTEGKVRVDDAAKGDSLLPVALNQGDKTVTTGDVASDQVERVLSAGHRAVIAVSPPTATGVASAVVAPIAHDEMQRQLAWHERRLEFVLAPLAEIAAEFNRYNRHQLVIGDERLGAKRFGGAFEANDPMRFVRMLRENFPVVVDEREGRTILTLAP